MWNKIVDPESGVNINIHSKKGSDILKKYLHYTSKNKINNEVFENIQNGGNSSNIKTKTKIKKNDTIFYVSPESKGWFNANVNDDNSINPKTGKKRWQWESTTFKILSHYADPNSIYIDIGAWIGPTVLYAAPQYGKVYCFEPDPTALKKLKANLKVNHFKNVELIEKGLSNKNGTAKLGGNGPLGNSESTLLVNDEDFIEQGGEKPRHKSKDSKQNRDYRNSEIVTINTITPDTFIKEYDINVNQISLIKIDIEGGEKIVVPAMKQFLNSIKPTLYISLHWVFIKEKDIKNILNILFNIYHYCYKTDLKTLITKTGVLNTQVTSLIFTQIKI